MEVLLKIIKNGYGYKEGHVITPKDDFEKGHLLAFGFAVNYEPPKPELKAETQMVAVPEVRVKSFIHEREEPVKIIVEPERKGRGLFKRGRPKKGN